jgi:hypothetical protein
MFHIVRFIIDARRSREKVGEIAHQAIAPRARTRTFHLSQPSAPSSNMMLLEILIQSVINWSRDIFVEILRRHAENFVVEHFKRKRRQKNRLPRRRPAKRPRLERKR